MTVGICSLRECAQPTGKDRSFCVQHVSLLPLELRSRICRWRQLWTDSEDQEDARRLRRNYVHAVRDAKAAINQRMKAS